MDIEKANENVKTQIKVMSVMFGSQKELASLANINECTLCRHMQDPGSFTLAELRKIMKLARKNGIPFDPLEVLP